MLGLSNKWLVEGILNIIGILSNNWMKTGLLGLCIIFVIKYITKLYEERKEVDELKKVIRENHDELKKEVNLMKDKILIIERLLKEFIDAQRNTGGVSLRMAQSGPPPAPPAPPPPPPLPQMFTPVPLLKIKLDQPTGTSQKKGPGGPPQLSFSKEEITSMLSKLKKTRNKKLVAPDDRRFSSKTPPRRNLFSRCNSSGHRKSLSGSSIISPSTRELKARSKSKSKVLSADDSGGGLETSDLSPRPNTSWGFHEK
uniref:Uncharacterized protein n=1 Tax=Homalodisca liturata TaxID=320908 RepID=A0A1B6I0B7_9HEMI